MVLESLCSCLDFGVAYADLLRFHLSSCARCFGRGFHGQWSLFRRKPCPTWSVPLTSMLLSAASLLGGIILNLAPPPFALGENLRPIRLGQRRCLGVAPFLNALPWLSLVLFS
jgi:hypothetical protein